MQCEVITSNRVFARLFTTAMCFCVLFIASGCGPTTTTTTSYVDIQTGTTAAHTPDITAVTAIDINSGNTSGCFAYGGVQPPAPPLGSGWVGLGTSPKPGECKFSGYVPGTWDFDFYSSVCQYEYSLGATSQYDLQGFLTTNSSGYVSQTVCSFADSAAPSADTHFALSNALPSSVTVSASGLTTSNGMPQLLVYDSGLNLQATVTAGSVASDGSSATFPFPASLTGGMYMLAVKNIGASGQFKVVDATHYSIGKVTTMSSAFGVDAADVPTFTQTCVSFNGNFHCSNSNGFLPNALIFTQYYSNQVTYGSKTIPTGSEPVAVKFFGSYTNTTTTTSGNTTTTTTTTHPANAFVVNAGSNSTSIIDLQTDAVTNIAVGTQPIAVAMDGSYAYVANYASGTLSEVNLSTKAVSRTATVAAGIESVAIDPSDNYIWVGGNNYLYEVSKSSFTVVAQSPVSGSVTSLAASNAQNKLAYTLVQNCCSSSSTYSANEVAIASLSSPTAFAPTSAQPYAQYTMNGTLPSAAVLPEATTVSAQFGNGLAASSTPTGFVVYDIVSNKPLMSGTTPTPVRGIAADNRDTVVYFTLPDSNEYLSVPLPYPPQ